MPSTPVNALALVKATSLRKYFPVQRGLLSQLVSRRGEYIRAVDGIDFEVEKGDVYGLVGESGSGKTTTGRMTTALVRPTSGTVSIEGTDIFTLSKKELRRFRRKMQFVFQDPKSSLNPRMRIGEAVAEPLRYLGHDSLKERASASKMLEMVGLSPPHLFYDRYPQELSGGQRQRVVIARALIVEPEYLVADEPVAMVDVSVRAQIMDLMLSMRRELNLTMLLITHDLAVAKYLCNKISVMYLGKIVETGRTEQIFTNPLHPYTQALLAAVPIPDPKVRSAKKIPVGEIPSALNPPSGCRFHPRCPYAFGKCSLEVPELIEIEEGHMVSCYLYPRSE